MTFTFHDKWLLWCHKSYFFCTQEEWIENMPEWRLEPIIHTRHMYLLFDSFCEFPRPLTKFHDTNPWVYLAPVSDGFVRINRYRLMNWGKNKVRKKCALRSEELNSFYFEGHLSNQNSIKMKMVPYLKFDECL